MPRIKKLYIFISKQFALLFVATFFICLFVLMMQFVWRYIDDLIGKGLSMEVLAQFFWYMGLMLVPQAFPLAILLSSLIAFGNLGESSELTAMKAAGISLMQTFRPLIVISFLISLGSFYFQNNIGPKSNMKMAQLFLSMRQKSPELEIPQGVFYDGIPNCNLYVQKKDLNTGKLYGIMIYRMTGSYEDQAIILADSGMIQSTAEKKHLLVSLWSGEWFENMQSQELAGAATVPYRRETFASKQMVIDFNTDFSLTDMASLSNNAKGKSINQIRNDIDSLDQLYDSIGHAFYRDYSNSFYFVRHVSRTDSLKAIHLAKAKSANIDSVYEHLNSSNKQQAVNIALSNVQNELSDLNFRSMITSEGDSLLNQHKIELINKFTLALTCMIFFFIGAPLGAIIRKGGLGVPVIVSIFVFILYYMLDNTGYRMARGGMWTIGFGKGLAPAVLIPLAAFVTYKAQNDSYVFNIDIWRSVMMRMLGLRLKRHISGKEVIINDPLYAKDVEALLHINRDLVDYSHTHNLRIAPNVIKIFFKYLPDHNIESLNEELENVIEDLSNTRDKVIMHELNNYPILAVKAHTRPFEHRWMNTTAAIIVPVGMFFYIRMWIFRLRMYNDLRTIKATDDAIIERINDHILKKDI